MRKISVSERRFVCDECKTLMTAYKSSSKMTKREHTKHMYCYCCKKVQPFTQLSKWE